MGRDMLEVKPGDKVKFLNRNGYDCEPITAVKEGLVEGGVYTVQNIRIGSCKSYVFIDEFPKNGFNTVMFSVVD